MLEFILQHSWLSCELLKDYCDSSFSRVFLMYCYCFLASHGALQRRGCASHGAPHGVLEEDQFPSIPPYHTK